MYLFITRSYNNICYNMTKSKLTDSVKNHFYQLLAPIAYYTYYIISIHINYVGST